MGSYSLFTHLGFPSVLQWGSLPLVAPLQLKGCTRTSSLSTSTTPPGASLCTVRTGSNRRVPPPRGSLLAARPWAIPSGSSSCSLVLPTRRHLMPRSAACGPVFGWVRSPFFVGYFFLVQFAYVRGVRLPGQTDAFPVCVCLRLWRSCFVSPRSCLPVPPARKVPGRPDLSRSRSSTSPWSLVPRSTGSLRIWRWIPSKFLLRILKGRLVNRVGV